MIIEPVDVKKGETPRPQIAEFLSSHTISLEVRFSDNPDVGPSAGDL
jgi:hypothetical protein